MSTAEKLRAMEAIWEDLSHNEEQVESPAWHEQVLKEREALFNSGKESPIDWEGAKERLRGRRP
ncbi:MAG: acyl-protein synthetase [Pedosphaera sp.]|nr:acyl-protein synthetase [Pedosphaera sp.]